MNNLIWRITNNGTQGSGNTGPIGDLPANVVVDIDADLVAIRWGASGPGAEIDRFHVQNQVIGIISTTNNTAVGSGQISTTGADNVARMQLITQAGRGKILYDSNDH